MQYRPIYYTTMPSPLGQIRILASDKGICSLQFLDSKDSSPPSDAEYNAADTMLLRAKKQLEEYFAKARQSFDLHLDLHGSIFELKAWKVLQEIPYGETIAYGEQARRVGDANKARAVGAANRRNHLPIIIPCHRVIGADGKLVGFSRGLHIKEFLLKHESRASCS